MWQPDLLSLWMGTQKKKKTLLILRSGFPWLVCTCFCGYLAWETPYHSMKMTRTRKQVLSMWQNDSVLHKRSRFAGSCHERVLLWTNKGRKRARGTQIKRDKSSDWRSLPIFSTLALKHDHPAVTVFIRPSRNSISPVLSRWDWRGVGKRQETQRHDLLKPL